jgi:osmoprotectant transport system ATP-binding protein
VIDLEGVEKRWGKTVALAGVTLSIARGELVVLVGESGSGKTTTLELVNRLAEPTAGTVRVAGRDVASRDPIQLRRSIGTVFQRFALFPHMTVADNVGLVPRLEGWSHADIERRVHQLLELIGLSPDVYAARFPRALSGGQQQRVGLARALAARPEILLMDEPFGALDPVTRDTLSWECRGLHDRLGLTTLMVTHDMTEALLLADRIAVMHAGSILQVGTAEELLREPAHPQVSALLETPRRQIARLGRLSWIGARRDEPEPD